MRSILANPQFRSLFAAQLVALLGTGLASVALGLLAYDLDPDRAGMVLGTVLTIKMAAYVGLSPIAAAIASTLPRRQWLVSLDVIRAGVAMCFPFVTEIWQVYVLIFLLQAASAGFTPVFQATIPDILPIEADYTKALSLSRLAYDLETLVSPALAGLLLLFVSFSALFWGTALGFAGSALLVMTVVLPCAQSTKPRSFIQRMTRGVRIYLATPRLRGLLALNMAAAAAGAMVFVNTVPLVRGDLGLTGAQVALALGVFGAGSMVAALTLPRVLTLASDRRIMTLSAAGLVAVLGAMWAWAPVSWGQVLVGWGALGLFYSALLTPSGRLLRRSAHDEDRPAIYAAQFALSHACWLLSYPLSGWLMTSMGASAAMLVLALGAAGSLGLALWLWHAEADQPIAHRHADLPADHPHLHGATQHSHVIVIDDYHAHWPRAKNG